MIPLIDKLIRSRRRSVALVVTSEATLVVRAPFRVSLEAIEKLVAAKQSWIEAKKREMLKHGGPKRHKQFVLGEEFFYLGERYVFTPSDGATVRLADGALYFPKKFLRIARKKMLAWYKMRAAEVLTERAHFYSAQAGWAFASVGITSAEKQWGSCSPRGHIHFSYRLAMAPPDVIDYVVVHELAHTRFPNHSERFWANVAVVLPDYARRRKWLREDGRALGM